LLTVKRLIFRAFYGGQCSENAGVGGSIPPLGTILVSPL
jgi:hypothetical protein